jgi:hypothetical protein
VAAIEIAAIVAGLSDRFQSHEVLIDGQRCGTVNGGETRLFEVQPGIHTIRLKLQSHSSPAVKVVVGLGKTSVVCETVGRRRFGLFSSPEPTTHIQVREEPEVTPPRGKPLVWGGEDVDVLGRRAHAFGN